MTASSSYWAPTATPYVIDTLTRLSGINIPQAQDGLQAYVQNMGKTYLFLLDGSGAGVVDGVNVLTTQYGGLSRWVQIQSDSSPAAQNQTTWFVDPVGGSDTNDGKTSATALKTLANLGSRLFVANFQDITVNLLNDVPNTDSLRPITAWGATPSGGTAVFINLFVRGVETTQATGVVTAGTAATVPATNTQAILEDTTTPIVWAAHVGRMVVFSTGVICWVLKDLGANQARVTEFYNPVTDTIVAAPVAGTTFKIVTMTQFAARYISAGQPAQLQINFESLDVNNGTTWLGNASTEYRRARITNVGAIFNNNLRLRTFGVLINPTVLTRIATFQGQRHIFRATGFLNVDLQALDGAHLGFDTAVFQTSRLRVGQDSGTEIQSTGNAAVMSTAGTNRGLGVFDSPAATDGIMVARCGIFTVAQTLYGSGNAVRGVACKQGGTVQILSTITPTITGASGDVQLEANTTAIPGLVPGAVVPAASALNTWANWTGAPFSRFVMSVGDPATANLGGVTGARIFSYTDT